MLDQTELHSMFEYKPETGDLVWRYNRSPRARSGAAVGIVHASGYKVTHIRKKNYLVHRLVWALHHGKYPSQLDHINGNKLDNRIENLRECTSRQNGANKGLQRNNKTGFKGVSYCSRQNRYQATCRVDGKKKWLGYFDSAEAASSAYQQFAMKAHGDFYKATTP